MNTISAISISRPSTERVYSNSVLGVGPTAIAPDRQMIHIATDTAGPSYGVASRLGNRSGIKAASVRFDEGG